MNSGEVTGLVMSASAGSGGEGEFGVGSGGVSGAGVCPGVQDQDDGVVEGPAPGVALAVGMVLAAAVLGAGRSKLAEGDRVAAGLGEEVPAVA